MNSVGTLRRVIAYNQQLYDVLVGYNFPFIRMYIGSERPFEVKLGTGKPSLLVTLVPLPNDEVRLIIVPTGLISATSISSFPDKLLKQKLLQFFKELA